MLAFGNSLMALVMLCENLAGNEVDAVAGFGGGARCKGIQAFEALQAGLLEVILNFRHRVAPLAVYLEKFALAAVFVDYKPHVDLAYAGGWVVVSLPHVLDFSPAAEAGLGEEVVCVRGFAVYVEDEQAFWV